MLVGIKNNLPTGDSMAKTINKSGKIQGRPEKVIDKLQFEELCKIHCTKDEIANIFKMHHDTLNEWTKKEYGLTFLAAYNVHSAGGKSNLRRRLMDIAMNEDGKGAVTAAIWLSKNYLGMSDKLDISNNDVEPFIIQTRRGDFKLGMQKKEEKDNDTDRTADQENSD